MYLTQEQKEYNAQVANRVAVVNAHHQIEMAARRINALKEKKQRKEQLARLNEFMNTLNQ